MTTFELKDLALANVLFACVHFVISGPKTEPRSRSHHANGFIHLHFRPPVLRLHPGDVTSGRIDVAVHDAADLDSSGSPWIVRIRPCCLDPAIAEVDRSPDDVVLRLDNFRSSAADVSFQVGVRGLRMGRTALRFYVTKNCSFVTRRARQSCAASGGRHDDQDPVTSQRRPRMHSKITEDDPYGNNETVVESFENEAKVKVNHSRSRSTEVTNDTVASFPGGASIANSSSLSFFVPVLDYYDVVDDDDVTHNGSDVTTTTTTSSGVRWWIPQEYHVIVCRPVDRSTMVWFNYLLMVLTSVNLVGAGGQVDPIEAIAVLRRPTTLVLGLFSRFAVTPVVSNSDGSNRL